LTGAPSIDYNSLNRNGPMTVTLTPLSSKAKNRLANQMGGNPLVTVEQRDANDLFCVSADGNWCAWVNCLTDPNWAVRF